MAAGTARTDQVRSALVAISQATDAWAAGDLSAQQAQIQITDALAVARLTLDALDQDTFARPYYDGSVLHFGDQSVDLSGNLGRLFDRLWAARGAAVSKSELKTTVWGHEGARDESLQMLVSRLRDKLPAALNWSIETVRNEGYRLSRASLRQAQDLSDSQREQRAG